MIEPVVIEPVVIEPAVTERSDLRLPALGLLAAGLLLPVLGHPGIGCPLRATTGIPCPLCGMSTSVQSTVRGQVDDALSANPMGVILVAVAIAVVVGLRIDIARIPKGVVITTLAAMWLFQLTRFSIV